MDLFDIAWNMRQSQQINAVRSDASEAQRQVRDSNVRVAELEAAVAKLQLIAQALWEIQQERGGIEEQALIDKVNEIDLRDGRLDGKLSGAKVRTCSGCNRPVNSRHLRCIYCGAENPEADVFRSKG
ncbi:MAG: hypothetical protein NTW19_14680 [Planctomycetota bacterium]|nr:hypothetical protein [Planctomycetota bacterium]